MRHYIYISLALLTLSCKDNAVIDGHHHHDHGSHGSDIVELTSSQYEVAQIQVGEVMYKNLESSLECGGTLELPPQNEASVSTMIGARVVDIAVIEGDLVEKGQVLATIESPEFISIQEDFIVNSADLERLLLDFERKQHLHKEGAISNKAFEKSQFEMEALRGKVEASKAKLAMLGLPSSGTISSRVAVTAPISGSIRHVHVSMGKYIPENEEMFDIVDNDHIHMDLMVFEQDVNNVKIGQMLEFTLNSFPGERYLGQVFSIGKSFENDEKAVRVHADIMDTLAQGILPGMYVKANIFLDSSEVACLPTEAFVFEGESAFVFYEVMVEDDGHGHDHGDGEERFAFKKQQVSIGKSTADYIEVVSGLEGISGIVSSGAYFLQAELRKHEGGHAH